MDRSPRLAIAAAGAALLLTAAATAAQLPTAEQSAFDAIDRAGAAFNSAGSRFQMVESIAEVVDAAERALSTFAAADRARDAAGQRFEAAMGEAASLAVRCDNGYSCGGDNRLDYSDDLVAAYARNFEALSAMMAANADYVEAVGISGADAGRARAARLRRFANRMRGLQGRSGEAVQRRNALLDEVRAELDGASRLHSRAVEAHIAANRAAIDALSRAARMVSTAAARLTDDYYPATRAVEVTRAAAALDQAAAAAADPQVSNDSDATDQALEELIFASRETFVRAREPRPAGRAGRARLRAGPGAAGSRRAAGRSPSARDRGRAGRRPRRVGQPGQGRGHGGRAGRRRSRGDCGGLRQLDVALYRVRGHVPAPAAVGKSRAGPHDRVRAPGFSYRAAPAVKPGGS